MGRMTATARRMAMALPALAALTVSGCDVVYSEGDDEDGTPVAAVLELSSGQGFDLETFVRFDGVTYYNQTRNADQLVFPSSSACTLPGSLQPASGPAVCGFFPYMEDTTAYESLDAAYTVLSAVDPTGVPDAYFFRDADDVQRAFQVVDPRGLRYVFWLESLDDDGLFRFQVRVVQ